MTTHLTASTFTGSQIPRRPVADLTSGAPTPQQPQPQSRTATVRAGLVTDTAYGAVIPPLHLSVAYAFDGLGGKGDYDYSRSANPTRDLFAQAVAELEGGFAAAVTGSGMGAISAVVMALVPSGGTILAPHDCYGGTWRLLEALQRTGRLTVRLADLSDPVEAEAAIQAGCDVVWIETPSNPLLRITDLAAVAEAAHRRGAVVVADNTFASPVVQRPLALGADVVVHSATKYLNGHSDVVAGVVVAADQQRAEDISWWANTLGLTGSAFDSYLALRGLRTLHLRMAAAQQNAAAAVELLKDHPAVKKVHYPGLADHPQHRLAKQQMAGFGAIVTIELADLAAAGTFVDSLRCFSLAESLGGVESLVSHPASMTHAAMSAEAQQAAGITAGMLRLSFGVEDPSDLVADLAAALDSVTAMAAA